MFRDSPDQDVCEHIKTIDQIELLEDHRAVAAPLAQRPATQARYWDIPVIDRPLGGVD